MNRRRLLLSLTMVLLASAGTWYWLTNRSPQPPVLLITIDTLRADAIGSIGGGSHTPQLDELVRHGVLFDQATSAAPTTGPSHASILSGEFPYLHGYRNNGQSLDAETPWLPQQLQDAGYVTAAFISGFPLNHMFGFDRGFDLYDDEFSHAPGNRFGLSERSAQATTQAALDWLPSVQAKSWFAWVHYFDPHAPYSAPANFTQEGPRGGYLAEVAYVDHWLGQLVSAARRQDPEVIVIITSDHGEGLGDHGEFDHGLLLYQSTVRVPLLVNAPDKFPPQRSAIPVRTVDIAPTVLQLASLSPIDSIHGVDLEPLLLGGGMTIPPAYSESYFAAVTYGFAPMRAIRSGNAKRVEGGHSRYFDLGQDPGELHPAIDNDAHPGNARLESLLAQIPSTPPTPPTTAPVADAEAMARLHSLGYLGAGAAVSQARWDAQVDPESRLAEHNEILRAQQSLDSGDLTMAEARFRAILELSPENRVAWLRLGGIYHARRELGAAVEAFGKAVALDSLNAEAHYQYAQALTESRNYPDAADQWKQVVALQPERGVAWANLGTNAWMLGDRKAALDAMREAVRILPEVANIRENLVRIELKLGEREAALGNLEELARIEGAQFQLAALLAEQLAMSGSLEKAETWLKFAKSGQEGYTNAHMALATAFVSIDKAKARMHLQEVLRLDPRRRPALATDPAFSALLDGAAQP